MLRVCVHGVCVCSLLCVCTLDGLNAEHEFRVWVTILGRMSRHFHVYYRCCRRLGLAIMRTSHQCPQNRSQNDKNFVICMSEQFVCQTVHFSAKNNSLSPN